MKQFKLTTTVIACLFAISVQAQEHLTFKNTPITGNIASFAEKLQNKGFSLVKSEEQIAMFEGDFINANCTVYAVGTVSSNTVWKVHIALPDEVSWRSLKSSYLETKKQYQKKYGKGKSYEYFTDPYYEGDGYELQAISQEKCTYATFWDAGNGSISVQISGKHVAISYEDKTGTELYTMEKQEVIANDI